MRWGEGATAGGAVGGGARLELRDVDLVDRVVVFERHFLDLQVCRREGKMASRRDAGVALQRLWRSSRRKLQQLRKSRVIVRRRRVRTSRSSSSSPPSSSSSNPPPSPPLEKKP